MPILNLAIGNADAHGENVSFVLDARGSRLAPFYDLLATIDWPQMSPRLAMRVGRAGTVDELDGTAWARFAEDARITFPFLRRRGSAPARAIVSVCGAGHMLAKRTGLRAERIAQSVER